MFIFSDESLKSATTYISVPHASGGIAIAINNASGHPTTPRRPIKQTPVQTLHCPHSRSPSSAAQVPTCDQLQNPTNNGTVTFQFCL